MNTPAICNGCGNESPAWDQLCNGCQTTVRCQNCGNNYKRGQGFQEVNLCSSCIQEVFAKQDEDEEEIFRSSKSPKPPTDEPNDPYEEFGFDHQWELYDR